MAHMQPSSIDDDYEEIEVPFQKESTPETPFRIFSGTYNVRGRPNLNKDGILEKISTEETNKWLIGMARGNHNKPRTFSFVNTFFDVMFAVIIT